MTAGQGMEPLVAGSQGGRARWPASYEVQAAAGRVRNIHTPRCPVGIRNQPLWHSTPPHCNAHASPAHHLRCRCRIPSPLFLDTPPLFTLLCT